MSASACVKSIPIEAPFTQALASYLLHETQGDPCALARYSVILPSQRACRALAEDLARQSPQGAVLVPKLMSLGDLDPEELTLSPLLDMELAPAISATARQGLLLQLILKHGSLMGPYRSGPHRTVLAAQLAQSLGRLIDQMAWEGLDGSTLKDLVPETYATHWGVTLDFLKVITQFWPQILQERGLIDPAAQQRLLIEAYAQKWQADPPGFPVIAAGSTGSIPATAQLLHVIAQMPQGSIILPGLDRILPPCAWSALPITHPQYGMKNLLQILGCTREDVIDIPVSVDPTAQARAYALSAALQPVSFDPGGISVDLLTRAQENMTYVQASAPQEEALIIAIALREVVATSKKTAALVTPDRALAERVNRELMRWGLIADDSAGRALLASPLGRLFALIAAIINDPLDQISLLAILKDPLVGLHQVASHFEIQSLRGRAPFDTRACLLQHVTDPKAQKALEEFFQTLDWPVEGTLDVYLNVHLETLIGLLQDPHHPDLDLLQDPIEELRAASDCFAVLTYAEYALLIPRLLESCVVRAPSGHHPQLFILGPLEARTQKMDLMILSGLNEGTWPGISSIDPWLNRDMRAQFGLPLPERRIGLSAHDFSQACCAPRVILTRSQKIDGAPTVPSRWLMRLQTLFAAQGLQPFSGQDTLYHQWARQLSTVTGQEPCAPPAPCPPLEVRPRRLSVSAINMWMRDPYAFYAKEILKLTPLDPLRYELGPREKGILMHRVIELFYQQGGPAREGDTCAALLARGQQVFGPLLHVPVVHGFWWPRFTRIAQWLARQEQERTPQTQTLSEVWGEMQLETPQAPFSIFAKADRIDCQGDDWRIIDYKTGTLATQQEMRLGYASQLPLEAAIALHGHFGGRRAKSVSQLAFWKLSGGDPAGEAVCVRADISDLVCETITGLCAFISRYDNVSTPYAARPQGRYGLVFNPYIHLARTQAWSRGMEEDCT